MVIKLNTNKDKYFKQLLTLLGALAPFSALSGREQDLFAGLLTSFYSATGSKDERFKHAFSLNSRHQMRTSLGISKHSLNNLFTSLRKKGFISYTFIYPDKMLKPVKDITFQFTK